MQWLWRYRTWQFALLILLEYSAFKVSLTTSYSLDPLPYYSNKCINKCITTKIIKDHWSACNPSTRTSIAGHLKSPILSKENSEEGLAFNRYKVIKDSSDESHPISLSNDDGHIFSLLEGEATLKLKSESTKPLTISNLTHLYIPPGENAQLMLSSGSYALHVSGGRQCANGDKFLIRNERFAGAARNVLTPQYLSRRMFTNRDKTLQSKYGTQVAWFHTTMFDSIGLGVNDEGKGVFKMSYDNQTEVNVVYKVGGHCAVRFALHPYVSDEDQEQENGQHQAWSDWQHLDGETMYYLNESSDGDEVETVKVNGGDSTATLRNRHEVFISPNKPRTGAIGENALCDKDDGFVSLCCLFDPGPTGLEEHLPGKYIFKCMKLQTADAIYYVCTTCNFVST